MNIYYFILFGTGVLILYAYRCVHLLTEDLPRLQRRMTRISFLTLAIFVYATTSYLAVNRDSYREYETLMTYSVAGAITLNVTLVVICLFQLLADIGLLFSGPREKVSASAAPQDRGRRRFMNKVAIVLGGITLGAFAWGTTKGKYGWRILKNRLQFANLPQSFDGLRIVQISDLHLGSFNHNYGPLAEAVEMVNELEPDYIVFTGDLVNEKAEEADGWVEIFRGLKAKKGKYAILGNHDYGWDKSMSEEEKYRISREVIDVLRDMDMSVLANEHVILEHGGEKIGLVGVENWGYSDDNWFPTRGDYRASVQGMDEVPFKILLSHDPTHWDHHILGKEAVDLTLSGHTHGGQMGIRIPGLLELSAGRIFYKRYAGAYREQAQHLYVNRGLGFLIFPGRVGMPPEITLHELYRS